MKTRFLFLLIVISPFVLQAQMPHWTWAKSIATKNNSGKIATDKDGNSYITGTAWNNTVFDSDTLTGLGQFMFLAKYDSLNHLVWVRKAINDTSSISIIYSEGTSVKTDKDGNVYVAGYFGKKIVLGSDTLIIQGNGYNVFIVKYDKNGNELWAKSEGSIYCDEPFFDGLAIDKNENVYLTGTSSISCQGSSNAPTPFTISFDTTSIVSHGVNINCFTVKLDKNGNIKWLKNMGGLSIAVDSNCNVYFGNSIKDSIYFNNQLIQNLGFNILLAKCDSNGNTRWLRFIKSDFWGPFITTDAGNHIYMCGESISHSIIIGNDTINGNNFLIKYDDSGNLLWAKIVAIDFPFSLVATNTAVFVTGNTIITTYGGRDVIITKYDTNGNQIWEKTAGGANDDSPCNLSLLSNGDLMVLGGYGSNPMNFDNIQLPGPNNPFNTDNLLFFAKLSGTTGIPLIATSPIDLQLYPNPSSGIIHFQSQKGNFSSIKVFDQLGRILDEQNIYPNQTSIDLHALPDGIYYVKFLGKEISQTKKLVIQH